MSVVTEASENDENKLSELYSDEFTAGDAASWLLSSVYCMLIVILSLVLCTTHYITTDVSDITVDAYFTILCLIGSAWLVGCEHIVSSCRKNSSILDVKSRHTSNKWLKGILLLFGLAIIIKDTLEFSAMFQYPEDDCKKPVYFIAPLTQMIFTVAEVAFLFKHSKLHLQNFKSLNRFGAMHVIATNLSIWILVIIDEAMEGVVVVNSRPKPTNIPGTATNVPITTTESHLEGIEGCNMTQVYELLNNDNNTNVQSTYDYRSTGMFEPNHCYCNTSYCTAVSSAHSFLYPFLIEFSLITSCMMYIVWKNIGSLPHIDGHPVVKPSYKIHKSYTAFIAGGFIMTLTVVVLVFMNNSNSDVLEHERNYDNDKRVIIIFNTYEVALEVIMIVICVLGFILFQKEPRPVQVKINLDVVLLLVTIVGCLTLDVFYAFAVYTSMISKAYSYTWIWGAVYPIVDLTQCIVQVGFIIAGLSRKPVLETSYYEKVAKILIKSRKTTERSRYGECKFTNEAFAHENKVVIEVPAIKLAADDDNIKPPDIVNGTEDMSEGSQPKTEFSFAMDREKILPSDSFANTESNETDFSKGQLHDTITEDENDPSSDDTDRIRQEKIAYPSPTRIRIRDIVMFLLITNACMWTFWSLEGTSSELSSYPYQYYTRGDGMRNSWHTVLMICLPLSIFFRMHSCACLFEVWSLT